VSKAAPALRDQKGSKDRPVLKARKAKKGIRESKAQAAALRV
jgi:hypothetical protein